MTVAGVEKGCQTGDRRPDLVAPDLGRAIGILRDASGALRRLGVSHLAIFGSVARGTAGPGSDIDLMLDLDADAGLDVFDYAWIAHEIRRMMPSWSVDIALRAGMPPEILRGAEQDAVRVFWPAAGAYLEQILANIALIRNYTHEISKQAFIADPKTRDAVKRCLQRITEAARRIGDRLDEAHPDLELHKLRQFGSVLRHDYDAIDPDLVWAAVTRRLDDLEAACRRELEARRP